MSLWSRLGSTINQLAVGVLEESRATTDDTKEASSVPAEYGEVEAEKEIVSEFDQGAVQETVVSDVGTECSVVALDAETQITDELKHDDTDIISVPQVVDVSQRVMVNAECQCTPDTASPSAPASSDNELVMKLQQITRKNSELSLKLESSADKTTKERREFLDKMDSMQRQLDDTKKREQSSSSLCKEHEATIIKLKQQIASLHEQHLQSESVFKTTKDKLDRSEREIARLQNQLMNVQVTHEDRVGESERTLTELRESLDAALHENEIMRDQYSIRLESLMQENQELAKLKKVTDNECIRLKQLADSASNVLEAFQTESEIENEGLKREIASFKAILSSKSNEISRLESLVNDSRTISDENRMLKADIADKMRTLERMTGEKIRLTQAMGDIMEKTYNDEQSLVEKRVVAQLVVQYLDPSRSSQEKREVLELMTRILSFSDDEKRIVGARVGPPSAGDRSSLSSLWVQFLSNQVDQQL